MLFITTDNKDQKCSTLSHDVTPKLTICRGFFGNLQPATDTL